MTDIVFMDTETTGLSLDDDIWEFAAIRRRPDGTEDSLHFFIDHDGQKCKALPESFYRDHIERYDISDSVTPMIAADRIADFMSDSERPHIVGAVPNFDTERLAILLRRYGYEPSWHYHLIDVENLAVGAIAAARRMGYQFDEVTLPWKSDDLAAALGVEPQPESERHTAMGDVLWVQRWYDRVMG